MKSYIYKEIEHAGTIKETLKTEEALKGHLKMIGTKLYLRVGTIEF